jgi:PAS domain S-box-containing protein
MPIKSLVWRILVPFLGIVLVVAVAASIANQTIDEHPSAQRLIACAIAAAATILIALALVRRRNWLLPVRRLEQAAAQMARGEWNVRVAPHGPDGVRRMAGNLNALAAQAQKQLSDLQQQRSSLQTLVDTMPDPILAADDQGRVLLLNAPAAGLLSLRPEQAINQKLVNVVNNEQIVELYEAMRARRGLKSPGPLNREIRLARSGQRYTYQAVATRMAGGGSLLVLRDVSTIAGAAQMKTDFVANASHELRTPIAAIKIAFETLRDVYREDQTQSDRCISVIDGHLKRLEEMLGDLLDLGSVENPDLKPQVAAVKTSELFGTLRSTLGAVARQKNVELQLDESAPDTPAEFRSDSRLLNLVLKNLVENSVKFTPAGGRVRVTVSLNRSPAGAQAVALTVADTGIGIAAEHIDRVFERFYQVDAARSGSAGRGTGLGLAIVKHAVYALNGTVSLESSVGKGTTVTCELPQPADQPASA